MAEKTEFLQAIDDAILDADSLERFINGSDSETVLTRLSAEYPTLQNAIKQMFENGGVPATPYNTYDEMVASTLPSGSYGVVMFDSDEAKNGYWKRSGSVFYYAKYNLGRYVTELEESILPLIKKVKTLEWQPISGGNVTFNNSTKTLSINKFILATYSNTTGRIRINDISIQMPGAYDICYLDLDKLGNTANIDSSNYENFIFVGDYNNGYNHEASKVPLCKYNSVTKLMEPCAGFVEISNNSAPLGVDNSKMQFSKTASKLEVYIPQNSGNKFNVSIQHEVVGIDTSNTQSNADVWRLLRAYRCNSSNIKILEIVTAGEWSCAMTHTEATQNSGVSRDHVGGWHGDEVLTQADFYIDGVRRNADFVSDVTTADSIQLVQNSVIYYQNTTRPLADHAKVITIKNGRVNVKQKLNFKYENTQLNSAWIAMLPILRTAGSANTQITDSSSRSADYYSVIDDNATTAFEERYTKVSDGSVIKQWSNLTGISATTTLVKAPNFTDTQNAYISNSSNYNKLYVSALRAGDFTPTDVPIDTVWEWETEYEIKC